MAVATVPALASEEVLEEVIVTAQYRAENLQETPIAITAISGEELEERAVTSAYEVAYTVPNASFRPAQAAYGNTVSAYIRGIGQYDFDFAFEPGVGVYIDDVYHPFTLASSVELLDLERVEVLRGPQGTLFGRGTIGGAVRYITRKPQGDDTGSVTLTKGDNGRLDVRGSFDFAVADNLFARVTGSSTSRGGYQDVLDFTCVHPELSGELPTQPRNRGTGCKIGEQGGEDTLGARATLRWVTSDSFELTLGGDIQRSRAEPKADTILLALPDIWPSNVEGVEYDERFVPDSPFISYATYDDPVSGFSVEPRTRLDKWTATGRADWTINDQLSAALIAAYTDLSSTLATDADGSPLNMQTVDGVQTVDFTTVELRFSGRSMDRVDWTVGAFYYTGDAVNDQRVSIPALSAALDGRTPEDPTPFVNAHNVHDASNKSVFGHAVFELTDRLSLTTGLRHSKDSKHVDFDNTRVQNPNVVVKGKKTDWRIGLDAKVTDDVMVYGSASTGYRPGAYNSRPFQVTGVTAVDQEESRAYELGFKADLFDRRLRLNVAGYYTDWNVRILPVAGTECLVLDAGPPPVYLTVPPETEGAVQDSFGNWCPFLIPRTFYENTPGKAKGVEAEVLWQPVAGLGISASYGMLDWKSPDITGDATVVSDRPVFVPGKNWSLGASYGINLSAGATLTPRIDVYGQTKICTQTVFTSDVAASPRPDASCSPGYELVNARLEWASPERKWSIAGGATNLTGKKYFLNIFDLSAFGQPTVEGQPGRPREWYLSITRNFR